jgi:transcriptional regulator with XRE-family HTH domain
MLRPRPSLFGQRLRELRMWLRLSPDQVAVRAKINPVHLRKIELGYNKDPRLSTAKRIADALGFTVDEMLTPAKP